MNPGPELDAKVAVEVMKWHRHCSGVAYWHWQDSEGMNIGSTDDSECFDCGNIFPRFSPSIDIVAAWEVVEKLQKQGLTCYLTATGDGNYQACRVVDVPAAPVPVKELLVNGYQRPEISNEQAKTMPHAICLAALKAVGVEVE